ncbi:ArsA family ATPase [Halogranum rubrum]|uniref:Arsenite-activated ATPase ArsA n=1 Tax=Halogranum salarium B-1 TaxID=1210908 RepID=J3JDY8_9EURY|nr:ArsA family ATPase [Halogranum salarium]EJN57901.1 arsenite-activated ATPase ArsA [Halogranum salarium B-1]
MTRPEQSEQSARGRQRAADVVLYGGKGGVGKTTCAAAHALALGTRDPAAKTLVVSTDPAHSLGDAFERELTGEPQSVTDSVDAVEVDPERGQEAYRGVVEALADEFRDAGLRLGDDDLERLFEAGLVPGGDEVAALEYIARYANTDYDHVVFDTAPTGHTLRLLDLPAVLGETLGVAGEVQRRVNRTARAARSMVFGPAAYWGATDESDEVASLRDRVDTVGALLRDPSRTAFRVVLTPESMAISEAERLVARLRNASVPVDAMVLNRLFENRDDCSCDRCQRDAARHARRRQEVDDRFDLPVSHVPQLEGEAHGLDALTRLGPSLVTE